MGRGRANAKISSNSVCFYTDVTFFFPRFPEGAGLIIKNIYIAQMLINILSAGKEGIVLAGLPFPSSRFLISKLEIGIRRGALFRQGGFFYFF